MPHSSGLIASLLRYATRLATVMHVPPLPLVLLECLCRGTSGAREPEATAVLWEEAAGAVKAVAHATAAERTEAVRNLLRRVAKRLELRLLQQESEAAKRRKAANAQMGRSVEDVAAQAMQRGTRAFIKKLQRVKDAAKPVALIQSGDAFIVATAPQRRLSFG